MQRVLLTCGVHLGPGQEIGVEGEIREVEDHTAKLLIRHNQARIAPAPGAESAPDRKSTPKAKQEADK